MPQRRAYHISLSVACSKHVTGTVVSSIHSRGFTPAGASCSCANGRSSMGQACIIALQIYPTSATTAARAWKERIYAGLTLLLFWKERIYAGLTLLFDLGAALETR